MPRKLPSRLSDASGRQPPVRRRETASSADPGYAGFRTACGAQFSVSGSFKIPGNSCQRIPPPQSFRRAGTKRTGSKAHRAKRNAYHRTGTAYPALISNLHKNGSIPTAAKFSQQSERRNFSKLLCTRSPWKSFFALSAHMAAVCMVRFTISPILPLFSSSFFLFPSILPNFHPFFSIQLFFPSVFFYFHLVFLLYAVPV